MSEAPLLSAPLPTAEVGEAVCAALRAQVEKLGLTIGDEPIWSQVSFEQAVDPFSQEVSAVAYWRGGARFGKATFFPDGRIFAEYQVLQPHPSVEGHYVDYVQVWGKPEKLRGDAVLEAYAQ